MPAPKREQLIQEAEKLAARGKLDAAVKEYQRALEQAPHDTTTLNRLGDLLVKANRIDEAIDVYRRIGDHFAEDGFFLKAIAIFKKINRFDPQRTAIYERLADLYYKQGLAVEGRQQLLTLAEWFTRSHNLDEALRVFRRLAELEPGNFQVRAKLVDALIQRGDVAAVMTEIDGLGQTLLGRGMLDEAAKLYQRAVELEPGDVDFVARCVDALVENGRAKQAVDLAARAMGARRPGLDLARAAALAYSAAGDSDRARALLERRLAEAHDRVDFVQAYVDVLLKAGDLDAAKHQALPLVDRLVTARDGRRAVQLLRRMLKSTPADVEILERAARVFNRREEPELSASIETSLADAYFRAGRAAEALPIYRRLVEESPDNPLFAERLASLSGVIAAPPAVERASVAPAAEPAEPPPAVESSLEFVDLDLGEVGAGDAETAISFALPEAQADAAPAAAAQAEAAPAPGPAGPAQAPPPAAPPVDVETTADELYTEAVVFAKYGLTDKATAHLQRLLELQPSHGDALELLTSLSGQPVLEDLLSPPEPAAPPPADALPGVDVPAAPDDGLAPLIEFVPEMMAVDAPASIPADAGGVAPVDAQPPAASASPPPAQPDIPVPVPPPIRRPSASGRIRVEDLEAALGITRTVVSPRERKRRDVSVEFDAASLLAPPAAMRSPLAPVEWSAPGSATAAPSAPPAGTADGAAGTGDEIAGVFQEPVEVLQEAAEVVDVAALLGGPDEEKLREVDFLVAQGLLDEAGSALAELREAFPDHAEVVNRQAGLKARGWEEAAKAPAAPTAAETATAEELFSEEEQFFDLAAELERELADEDLVAEATGSSQGGEVSIEELFKEFQRGVAEQVSEQDFDTHFNLGLAYREMGLHDEAIGEFQLAGKSPDYFVECASMIGACYMDKGLPEHAAEWYDRALKAPGLPAETELGLRYELGRTQEAAGNADAALACYAEVLAINPAFRDVVDRISRLQTN